MSGGGWVVEGSIEGHEDFYKESEQQRLETSPRVKKKHIYFCLG